MISSAELFFHTFFIASTVDYRGSKLITHDYYWLFSMYGYPPLQILTCKADWQYHGSTTLTVEYILLINLLLQNFVFVKIINTTRSYSVIQCLKVL